MKQKEVSEEDSYNEDAMFCFVAIEEINDEGNETKVNEGNPTYDDLLFAFEQM